MTVIADGRNVSALFYLPMPNSFMETVSTAYEKMVSVFTGPFSLKDVPGFPYQEYMAQQANYNTYKSWYSGTALNEQVEDPNTGQKADKYPIKINPLQGTCAKHATVLFGLTVDSIRLGGIPFKIVPNEEKGKKKAAKELAKKLSDILTENNAGSIFLEGGIKSQYLGGHVFAAKWRSAKKSVEVTTVGADEFIGIAEGTNWFRLKEGWIVRKIAYSEAKSYISDLQDVENEYYYLEHWTKTHYKCMVNNHVITLDDGQKMDAENPFGIVPIVYIPHIRDNGLLGKSLVTEAVQGIIKEMNLRWADVGDAVSEDSHGYIFMRNVQGSPNIITLADGRKILDIGSSNGLSVGGSDDRPDLAAVKGQSASEPMLKFGAVLEQLYRREVDHPSVADGEDQGSQRSSLTLNTRMWPLISHVELERTFWTVGLLRLLEIISTIMNVKEMEGFSTEAAKTKFIIEWAPMLPRDREVLIQEIAIRAKNKIGTIKHLMSLLDDVDDPEEMYKEVVNEAKELQEAIAPPVPPGGTPAPTGKGNPDQKSNPNNPQGNNEGSGKKIK